MKKLVLTAAFVAAALSGAMAQKFYLGLEAGFWRTSGKTELGSTSVAKGVTTSGTFAPYLGYSFTDNLSAGLGFGIDGESYETPEKTFIGGGKGTLTNTTRLISVSPFFRYTKSVGDNLSLWGQLNVAPSFGSTIEEVNLSANTVTENKTKLNGLGVNIRPGFNYRIADKWIFTGAYGSLGYSSLTETVEAGTITAKDKTSTFGLNLDANTLRIGFNYLF